MMAAVKHAIFGDDEQTKARKAFANACAAVFERTPEGMVLLKLMKVDLEAPTYVQGDSHQTAFNEGSRDYPRKFFEALKFYHSGMNDKTEVLTERPKADADRVQALD